MAQTPNRRGTTTVRVDDENMTPAQLVRLSRLGRELRLLDQILSTDLDTVSIVQSGPAPAWTTLDGDHVSFALGMMPFPNDKVDVAVWLGTNAHELGHVLFSPRRYSPLMQRVIDGDRFIMPGLSQLHNILEDQRQERLILGRFAPWRSYLVAALGHHITVNDESAWLLLCGRTWLPAITRDQAKARFVVAFDQSTADEVASIVGEYQHLVDPGFAQSDEAWDLLERLHSALPHMPTLPSGCAVMVGGEPDTDPSVDADSAPPSADEADGDQAEGEANEQGQGQGEEQDGDGADGNAKGKGDKPNDQSDDKGTGAGKDGTPPVTTTRRVREQLSKAAEQQIKDDKEASDDIAHILDALRNGRSGGNDIDGDAPVGAFVDVTDAARSLRHEVSDALLDLKDASEPGWIKRTDSGRLKVGRLINPNIDADEWFDRYEPGQLDASELEVFVLLDVSGSMSGYTHPLSEATWAIRHAVDDLEGSCTVFTFSSGEYRVLCGPNDRPDDRMFSLSSWGGTDPNNALATAYRTLADSQVRNRLMVVLTDGAWYEAETPNSNSNVIAAMNQAGITTVCALLGSMVEANDDHGCQFAAMISDPMELARLFRRVAEASIHRWM